jgi:hypothetical protein
MGKSSNIKCNILFPNRSPVDPEDRKGCTKECGHLDAHEFVSTDGEVIEWEDDLECTCGCMEEEGYPCLLYNVKGNI